MRREFSAIWTALFLASAATLVFVATGSHKEKHHFENRCNSCHLGMKDPSIMIRDVDILCLRCHPDENSRSHPSDFRVKGKLPEQFPLVDGKMMCSTCHYAHRMMGTENTQKLAAASYPYLLRFPETGKRFCFQCHTADSFVCNCGSHGTSLGLAHTKTIPPELLHLLDQSSRNCLACHDGTISRNVETGGASWEHAGGIGLSHPIGVYYADAWRKDRKRYHPEASLPKALRLVNGKIECVTCHDHYSKRKGLLVMDNSGSRLCLSCHNL
ncbi:MAG: cytochrome c3 family protein [Acidobacteria bacterium]|nr:cytochrome c3 family protein [Acidobacteriota bacterium]